MFFKKKEPEIFYRYIRIIGCDCDNCGKFIPPEYRVCHRCGEKPPFIPGHNKAIPYTNSRAGYDDEHEERVETFFNYMIFLSPLFWYINKLIDIPDLILLNLIILVPSVMIAIASLISFFGNKFIGIPGRLIRTWVFVFCVLTIITSIKYVFIH